MSEEIRADLKAWATRCLKQHSRSLADASGNHAERENWWAERGSVRFLWDDSSLEAAIVYVTEGQDIPR